jgi:hypothetical protein
LLQTPTVGFQALPRTPRIANRSLHRSAHRIQPALQAIAAIESQPFYTKQWQPHFLKLWQNLYLLGLNLSVAVAHYSAAHCCHPFSSAATEYDARAAASVRNSTPLPAEAAVLSLRPFEFGSASQSFILS